MSDLVKIELIAAFNRKDLPRIRELLAMEFVASEILPLDHLITYCFFSAASQGWLDVVQQMLDKNLAKLESANHGETALIFAAKNGHAPLVTELLSRGADTSAVTKGARDAYIGWNALHWAAFGGHCDVVQILTKYISPYTVIVSSGTLPIHLAAKAGHADVVEFFLNQDAGLMEAQDKYRQTPLLLAAKYGHLRVVNNLRQRKASTNVTSQKKGYREGIYTPYMWACIGGHREVFRELCLFDHILSQQELISLFLNASQQGQLGMVEELLEANSWLLDACDTGNQTAILWAASQGHLHVVDYLLGKGTNFMVATHRPGDETDGYTPLHWAAIYGFCEVVTRLLDVGARDEPIGKEQFSLIHISVNHHQLAVIQLLLQRNPRLLNQLDGMGFYPLALAAASGSIDVTTFLINQPGVFLNVPTRTGHTPLHLAIEKEHGPVVNILIYHLLKDDRYTHLQSYFLDQIRTPEQAMDFLLLDPENKFILCDSRISTLINQYRARQIGTVVNSYHSRCRGRDSFFAQVDLRLGSSVIYRPEATIGEGRENTVRIFSNQTNINDKVVVKTPKEEGAILSKALVLGHSYHNDLEAKMIKTVYPDARSISINMARLAGPNQYKYSRRLITEYFPGETASIYLSKVNQVSELLKAVILMLEKLMELHDKGVIHSDIKLDNMMVSDPEDIKIGIIDFGLSRLMVASPHRPPVYECEQSPQCAPELVCGQRIYPHPNQDVFSFAYCLLHEIVTRHPLGYELVREYPCVLEFIKRCLNIDPLKRDQSLHLFHGELLFNFQQTMGPAMANATPTMRN